MEHPATEATDWVAELGVGSERRGQAVAELHRLALRVAVRELGRRAASSGLAPRDREDLAHEVAADATLAILAKLTEFRGESRFSTWAYKFVVLEVSHKLARHYRRELPTPLPADAETWERFEHRMGLDPVHDVTARELAAALRRAIDSLTEHQRELFTEVVVRGVPLDVVVQQRSTNRNAVYKVVFDARRKIRAALVAEGYLGEKEEAP